MALDGASILITGGCGQIGIAIVKCLRASHPGAAITVLDLETPAAGDARSVENVTYLAANITDEAAMKDVFQTVKPLVVFHTAGLIPQIAERRNMDSEEHYMAVNFNGTKIVLEAAAAAGCVKALVYTSSAYVVKGNSWQNLVNANESMPVPKVFDNPYARSKAAAESFMLSSSTIGLPITALRTHAVFSADDNNLLPLMLSAPRNLHLGPGTNLYDFTYAPNLALAHILAAKNLLSIAPAEASNPSSAAGKAFFITNCEPVPFRAFLEMVWAAFPLKKTGGDKQSKGFTVPTRVAVVLVWISQKIAGIARKKPFLTMDDLGDSLSQRWFDNTAAKNVLGYSPSVTLAQGLREAAECHKLRTGA